MCLIRWGGVPRTEEGRLDDALLKNKKGNALWRPRQRGARPCSRPKRLCCGWDVAV